MASRRCFTCGTDWPTARKYLVCPVCETRTSYLGGPSPITSQEASDIVNHALFDTFYAEHDAKRKGPTPEELGHQDATVILDLERALEGETDGSEEDPG